MAEEKKEEPAGPTSPELHFEPVVKLDPIDIETMEENEEEIFKMRSKLFRYDSSLEPPEWKERGTGDVKLLKHKSGERVRLLMRRDKTFKICANHYIQTNMALKPSSGSDRAWVWNTAADFADEEAKPETLAIRFANTENAKIFKDKFEECQKMVADNAPKQNGQDPVALKLAEKLGEMMVKESETEEQASDEEADGEKKEGEKKEEKKEEEKKEDTKDADKITTSPKKEEETKDGGTENEKTESKD